MVTTLIGGIVHLVYQMRPIIFSAIALIGVGFLIAFHEFGHFIFCKIFKVKTPTFSIGVGPRLFTWRWKDTDFTLSALPLGGFVEIAEKPANEEPIKTGYFDQIPYYQKMIVIIGGIFCNLFFSWIAFTLLFAIGMPTSPLVYPRYATSQVQIVAPHSPAERAGLVPGDIIRSIGTSRGCTTAAECIRAIEQHDAGSTVVIVERLGQEIVVPLQIEKSDSGKGFLGVVFVMPYHSFFASSMQAFDLMWCVTKDVFNSFAHMFQKRTVRGLSGPIMLVSHVARGVSLGWQQFLLLLAFISLNLAILNLLPIPVMDGGQALFYTIEACIKRPLPESAKFYIRLITWLLLLILIVYMSISEIAQLMGFMLKK